MISFVSLERICSEFETINKKAQEVPENTEAIAQMVDYINYTKKKGVTDLNEKIKVNNWTVGSNSCVLQKIIIYYVLLYLNMHLQEASARLLHLLDVYIFEPEDLKLNSAVFLWPKNILHAFELSNEVCILHYDTLCFYFY